MLCAEAGVEPIVLSAAAGRIRVHAVGFRHNDAWAAAIEETVATVTGVRAVQAYPRTESVVVWYAPEDCDIAAVLSAIAGVQDVPAPSSATRMSQSPVARGRSSVRSTIIGWLARTLLDPHRDAAEAPPEIERLRAALDHIGYHLPPATAGQASMVTQVGRNGRRIR
jgi:cation-transporting ATPase V